MTAEAKENIIGMTMYRLRSDVDELTELASDISVQDRIELEMIAQDLIRLITKIKFKVQEAAE